MRKVQTLINYGDLLHARFSTGTASQKFIFRSKSSQNRFDCKQIRRNRNAVFIFFSIVCLLASVNSYGQRVSIKEQNVPLEKVFKDIQAQTGISILYSSEVLKKSHNVTIDFHNAPLNEVLDKCMEKQPLTWESSGNTIIIKPSAELPANPKNEDKGKTELPPAGTDNQSGTISGKVLDSTGGALEGATVLVLNNHAGTLTNAEGVFRIPIPNNVPSKPHPNVELQISFTGYATKKIVVNRSKFTTIILQPSGNELDVVQTMAYSKTSMRYNTGNVVTISSDQIEKNSVPNVLQALQGRVPGMFIQQVTGQPGGAFNVTVQGKSTFNNNSPLYIVDGVAYPSGTLPLIKRSQTSGNGYENSFNVNPLQGGNPLNYLDPSLIESVNVLEGADATAIYGSRGAYGVVLITTKRGASGKPSFSLNTYSGISERGTSPKLLNTQQYLTLRREAFANDSIPLDPSVLNTYPYNILYPSADLLQYDTTSYTNWQKELTGNNAMVNKFNASYSGGTQNLNFLIGANYMNQQNVQRGKGNDRQGGMNFDIRSSTPNKKLTVDLSGSFSTDVNTMVPIDFSGMDLPPDYPSLFLPDGHLNWSTGVNPASGLYLLYRNTTNNLTSNLTIDYVPLKGLTFHVTGGYNLLSGKEFEGEPSGYFNPATFTTSETQSTLNYYSTHTLTFEPNVNYTALVGGPKGRLNVTAGGTLQDQTTDNHSMQGSGFLSDALVNNPATAAQSSTLLNYNLTPSRYAGYFAVVNYIYDDKYILNLNGRRDGSTAFGSGKQYGNFGSAGAAWIISDEKWFKNNIVFIDFAKIRASYGTVGGDGIGNYQYLNTYNVQSSVYQGNPGLYPSRIANPYLQWETNKEEDAGLTLQFLKDRITFDGDYSYRTTTNQLINQPLSSITGFTSIVENVPGAKIVTRAYQFTLTTKNIQTKNFSWLSSLNMSTQKIKLVSYPGQAQLLNINYQIGKPITGVLLYKYDGVDPQTGLYTFTNHNGVTGPFSQGTNPQLKQDSDRTVFVDLAPKFYGGFNNSFTYKGITLSLMIYFVDEDGLNWLGSQANLPGSAPYNTLVYAMKRWQKPGDKTDVPKPHMDGASTDQNNFVKSSGAYSNAAFARLSNVNITYTFPAKWVRKAGISRLQVFASGQNLLTVSKYGGVDPENLNPSLMPPLRLYTGGLNITF